MIFPNLRRLACGSASVLAFLSGATVRGQTVDPVPLEPVVTTATRMTESTALIGTDVSVLDGNDLVRQQWTTLADALSTLPGGPLFSAGRSGASTSLFMRGANSDQVLFLIDGIRFNDANTDYGPFLGGWRLGSSDTLEIDRGPQSLLYGPEASGGLVALGTRPGVGSPSESLELEGGSESTVQGTARGQGVVDNWSYNSTVSAGRTDNGRPNNGWKGENVALRFDRPVGQYLTVGGTLRNLESKYGDPGDIFTNSLVDHETEEDWIGTVYAGAALSENFWGKLTLGGVYRRLDAYSDDFGTPEADTTRNERAVIDGQMSGRFTQNNIVTGGFDLEKASTLSNGFAPTDRREFLYGFFLQDEYTPFPELHLTGGLRRDDTSTFGSANTGRVTAAWLGRSHIMKLRGSLGTGFNAPSFLDLYAKSPFFVGNPHLLPEHSRGWDVGFDFYLPDDPSQVLGVTWFHSDFTNLIVSDNTVTPSSVVNAARARAQGLEVTWTTRLAGAVKARFAYTYLLAEDLASAEPLARRPRNSGNGDLFLDMRNGWTFGAGGTYVGQRADIDPQTFEPVDDGGYTSVRVYLRWQATSHLGLHARVENALNRYYEPVDGYPAPGRRYLVGADWKF